MDQKNHRLYKLNQDVKIIDKKMVYEGIFKIERLNLQFRLFSGGWSDNCTREVFHRGHGAGILLYDPWQDTVILTEQFRVGALFDADSPWLVELVAGVIDDHYDPEETVTKEAKEEANVDLLAIEPIFKYWVSSGGCSETMTLFCGCVNAKEHEGIFGVQAEGEDIKVSTWSFSKAMDALNNGFINNSPTIIALQWLYINKSKVAKKWQKL